MDHLPPSPPARALRLAATVAGAAVPLALVGPFLLGWSPVVLALVPLSILAAGALAGRMAWFDRADQPRARRRETAIRTAAKVGGGLILVCVVLVLLVFMLFAYAGYE